MNQFTIDKFELFSGLLERHLINFWKIQEWDGMRKQGIMTSSNQQSFCICTISETLFHMSYLFELLWVHPNQSFLYELLVSNLLIQLKCLLFKDFRLLQQHSINCNWGSYHTWISFSNKLILETCKNLPSQFLKNISKVVPKNKLFWNFCHSFFKI